MKNKTLIIWILVIVGALAVFLWQGGDTATLPVQSQVDSGSMLTARSESYDFGTLSMRDGVAKTTFLVVNETENDIRIDTIVTSCMCTTAYVLDEENKKGPFGMPGHGDIVPKANEVIKAGEEWIVEVVFDPAAHGPAGVGLAERYVYLVDEKGGALELEIKAMVTL